MPLVPDDEVFGESATRPVRVAVIGAGPAGIYTADALTRQSDVPVTVDLVDRLPTPFGLVRHGIAPDHAKMRAIRETLHRSLDVPGVRFVGNVDVGIDIGLDELRQHVEAALAGARNVVVVGVGNVALDVARVLVRTSEELEPTDMPQHVLDALAAS